MPIPKKKLLKLNFNFKEEEFNFLEQKINPVPFNGKEESVSESEKPINLTIEQSKNVIKFNVERYNNKFKQEDGNNSKRSIVVIENNLPQEIKAIQSQLKEGEHVGAIYSPLDKLHVDAFVISKNKVFVVSEANADLETLAHVGNLPNTTMLTLNTSYQDRKTSEARAIQSDTGQGSCISVALKTLKTLLSKNQNGEMIVETLPCKNYPYMDNAGTALVTADIFKIPHSNKLVEHMRGQNEEYKDKKLSDIYLTVGKHAGESVESHRLANTNKETSQNKYLNKLTKKYMQKYEDSKNNAGDNKISF